MTALAERYPTDGAGARAQDAAKATPNPREFMWSATAVSFGALMSVLQAYTLMRTQQMDLSNQVSTVIATATISAGEAQLESYQAQADQQKQQEYISIASAAGSATGIVGAAVGFGISNSASNAVKPMNELVTEVNTTTSMQSTQVVAGNINSNDTNLQALQNKLINEQFTTDDLLKPDTNGNTGLNKVMGQDAQGNNITLKDVIETTADQTQFQKAQAAISKMATRASEYYQTRQNYANGISQAISGVGSTSSNFASSGLQAQQATDLQKQGAAQQALTFSQAEQQFSNTTYGNIRQSAQYADSGVANIFSFINGMIQNEMRG
jgi:hypothetical protein